MAREDWSGLRLDKSEAKVVDGAKKKMGVTARSDVLRSLVALLTEAPDVLADVHRFLMQGVAAGAPSAAVLAERIEGVMRRLDAGRAAALTEARQAQAGGAA